MIIKFDVDEQTLTRTDDLLPVELSQEYLYAEFDFPDDSVWDDLSKDCYVNGVVVELDENNQCEIPYTEIKAPRFDLCLVGTSGDTVVTTNNVTVFVERTGNISGFTPLEPSPLDINEFFKDFTATLENGVITLSFLNRKGGATTKTINIGAADKHITSFTYNNTSKKFVITLSDSSTVECPFEVDLSAYVTASQLAAVATSGDYDDLSNKPTIPTISGENDGTNWTYITIGDVRKAIPVGGSSGGGIETVTSLPSTPSTDKIYRLQYRKAMPTNRFAFYKKIIFDATKTISEVVSLISSNTNSNHWVTDTSLGFEINGAPLNSFPDSVDLDVSSAAGTFFVVNTLNTYLICNFSFMQYIKGEQAYLPKLLFCSSGTNLAAFGITLEGWDQQYVSDGKVTFTFSHWVNNRFDSTLSYIDDSDVKHWKYDFVSNITGLVYQDIDYDYYVYDSGWHKLEQKPTDVTISFDESYPTTKVSEEGLDAILSSYGKTINVKIQDSETLYRNVQYSLLVNGGSEFNDSSYLKIRLVSVIDDAMIVSIPSRDYETVHKAYTNTNTNISVSTWTSDSTYSSYAYAATITNSAWVGAKFVNVVFGLTQAESGNYASICEFDSTTGTIKIFSKVNTSITIPCIEVVL